VIQGVRRWMHTTVIVIMAFIVVPFSDFGLWSVYYAVTLASTGPLKLFRRESVLFIGTQFSILYTFMYSPA